MKLMILGLAAGLILSTNAGRSQSADALINKLLEKGILTEKEAQDLKVEAGQTNLVSASKWKLSSAIKGVDLYGDLRFRYEFRDADNPGAEYSGVNGNNYVRERFRFAARFGIRGDLFDDFYYGLRLETSSNPRSPWITFGDDTNPTPFAKNSDGVGIGQAYLGWRATSWFEMSIGKMPMPLYVTPMIWDTDLNPEGAMEKFKHAFGNLELFANFGQFLYQDTNPDSAWPTSDTFMLAWQLGATARLTTNVTFRVAPVLVNYTGVGSSGGLNHAFTGEGQNGMNTNTGAAYNQTGINDLLVLETPVELNFKVGTYNTRVFGDFGFNFLGADRARAAAGAAGPVLLPKAYTDQRKAFMAGVAFGNLGLVYGQTSKKNTWEARAYWQHVEQYAADVNLLDSDFFEGRGNLQGIYTAFAYSITDGIIGTVRYGYANQINGQLGTGGANPDLPALNPIRNYHLLQLDVTWRF